MVMLHGGGQFNGVENGHVTEVVTLWKENGQRLLMEGEWLTLKVANGGKMVMLQRWSV